MIKSIKEFGERVEKNEYVIVGRELFNKNNKKWYRFVFDYKKKVVILK